MLVILAYESDKQGHNKNRKYRRKVKSGADNTELLSHNFHYYSDTMSIMP